MNVEDLFERYLTTKAQKMYERDESRRQTCQRKVDKVRGARGDLGAAFIIVEDDAGHCTNKDDLPFWWASCWDPSGVGSGGHLATTFLTGTLPATLRSQKKAGCKEPSARAILANSERKKEKLIIPKMNQARSGTLSRVGQRLVPYEEKGWSTKSGKWVLLSSPSLRGRERAKPYVESPEQPRPLPSEGSTILVKVETSDEREPEEVGNDKSGFGGGQADRDDGKRRNKKKT